ncbi:Di-copper centre-containing protein [Wilcoxina mikolae CBS 423.85]|nr:Di-copper centre-containing protein [Wilcoxina mikolae CBS 423.85]
MLGFRITSVLLLALTASFAEVFASPTPDSGKSHSRCEDPIKRKEWNSLSRSDKKSYIKAVQCLGRKPAKYKSFIPGATSRYDEFHGVHVQQGGEIHFVGHFIIWHRYFLMAMEKALREECGWKGGLPYWDWIKDAASDIPMDKWTIFDPKIGFGGNGPWVEIPEGANVFPVPGRTGGGCVIDGPFTSKDFLVGLGPGTNASVSNLHCLKRDFSPEIVKKNLRQSTWDAVIEQSDYGRFAKRLEAEPNWDMTNLHGGGHFGVGGSLGDMGDAYNSPGDPLFYLHHGNLDRLFWEWQKKDLRRRLTDVSGPIYMFDYNNVKGANITLDFEIGLGPLGKTKKLKELMDIRRKDICYTYV